MRSAGIAGAGINTTTSPSGRMITPRLRAANVTWCPMRRAAGNGGHRLPIANQLDADHRPLLPYVGDVGATLDGVKSSLDPQGIGDVVDYPAFVEKPQRGDAAAQATALPV